MKNKHKKIFKKCWYLSPLGLMFVMVPAIMSSCANISQYILPITTGVGMKGPFSNSYINGINDFFDQSLNTYLPTQYISYINRSGGNNVSSYGFDNPDNIDNNTPFGWGYHASNDAKHKYIKDNDTNNTIQSFKNLNLGIVSRSVSTISTTISSLFNTMVHFMSQTGVISNETYRDIWFNMLLNNDYSNEWHGSKDNPTTIIQNKKFYEFLFDINNLISTGKAHNRFDVASQNFIFETQPFIDKLNCLGASDSINSDAKLFNAYSNKEFLDLTSDIDKINDDVKAYASYGDCTNQNEDGNTYHFLSNFAYSIPSIVSLKDTLTTSATQFTYYDPTKNLGFIPNEYLNVDMDYLSKSIKQTNAWNKIDDLIGGKDKRSLGGISKRFGISTNMDTINADAVNIGVSDRDYEPGLKTIIEKISSGELCKADFLTLNSYNVASYKVPLNDQDKPDEFYSGVTDYNGNDKNNNLDRRVHIPLYYGAEQNVFPIVLLFKNININSQTGNVSLSDFDTDLLKFQTQAIYLDPKTGAPRDGFDGEMYKLQYLDVSKLNDKFLQFMTLLTTLIKKDTNPNDWEIKYKSKYFTGDINIPYFLGVFKCLFGTTSSNEWLKEIA